MVHLVLPLALGALQLEDELLGGLRLLPQNGLGLTSEALLLTVVSERIRTKFQNNILFSIQPLPPPTLGLLGLSRLFVLGHLELLVGLALGVGTVGVAPLGEVHHPKAEARTLKNKWT